MRDIYISVHKYHIICKHCQFLFEHFSVFFRLAADSGGRETLTLADLYVFVELGHARGF